MGYGLFKSEDLWPNGTVPYYFDLPPESENHYPKAVQVMHSIKLCMQEWMNKVNADGNLYIRFVESNKDNPKAKCFNLRSLQAQNTAGANGYKPGPNISDSVTINLSVEEQWQSIPHELGHVLGLGHENDRNDFKDQHPWDANQAGLVPTLCFKQTRADYDKEAKKAEKNEMGAPNWFFEARRVQKNRANYKAYSNIVDVSSIMHYSQVGNYAWNSGEGKDAAAAQADAEARCARLNRPLNRPLTVQVKARFDANTNTWVPHDPNNRWSPSARDIATVRAMYAPAVQPPQQQPQAQEAQQQPQPQPEPQQIQVQIQLQAPQPQPQASQAPQSQQQQDASPSPQNSQNEQK